MLSTRKWSIILINNRGRRVAGLVIRSVGDVFAGPDTRRLARSWNLDAQVPRSRGRLDRLLTNAQARKLVEQDAHRNPTRSTYQEVVTIERQVLMSPAGGTRGKPIGRRGHLKDGSGIS